MYSTTSKPAAPNTARWFSQLGLLMAMVEVDSSFFSRSAPTRSAPLPPTVCEVATRPAASSGDSAPNSSFCVARS
ncbi:hypothetical protein NB693_20315 [Pantoea ananatis]|nr:hypothetical protein [Pantoea ananatis]